MAQKDKKIAKEMKLSEVVEIAIFHNIRPDIAFGHSDHKPGMLCLFEDESGIHYSLCRKDYDCLGTDIWSEDEPAVTAIKFIHSASSDDSCKYCMVI